MFVSIDFLQEICFNVQQRLLFFGGRPNKPKVLPRISDHPKELLLIKFDDFNFGQAGQWLHLVSLVFLMKYNTNLGLHQKKDH